MIYEFKCKECGEVFEEIRPLSKNTNTAICPKCEKEASKIPSRFGFHVNGFASINGYSHGNV